MIDAHIIAHAEISIGESVKMISGAVDQLAPCRGGGFIYVANADDTYAKAMKAGARAVMPVKDNPRGRSGGIMHPVGNT